MVAAHAVDREANRHQRAMSEATRRPSIVLLSGIATALPARRRGEGPSQRRRRRTRRPFPRNAVARRHIARDVIFYRRRETPRVDAARRAGRISRMAARRLVATLRRHRQAGLPSIPTSVDPDLLGCPRPSLTARCCPLLPLPPYWSFFVAMTLRPR
ncbi:MAG TPA: hypothetical protein VMU33_02080 [Burkholderiaceae bacterium]|nr:hypothetical protein [Burkholderiaceae bacterium]